MPAWLPTFMLCCWHAAAFVLGACVGSCINVCVARIPMQKSMLWPGSRCSSCLQPIRGTDNIPLLSYLILRGRCRQCGAHFSSRYFFVELLTALGFLGLFHLDVIRNVNGYRVLEWHRDLIHSGVVPWEAWVIFAHHATLFSFLMIISWCDLDWREIPPSVTFTGAAVGLILAMLLPWPWPNSLAEVMQSQPEETDWRLGQLSLGLYPWPPWTPLPRWLNAGGNWQTGLVTGLAGLLMGTVLVRSIRFVFSAGLGKEALGLGDADLMMMAGSFLGWQPVIVAFFVGVLLSLPVSLLVLVVWRDNALAFGPGLAAGVLVTCLCWASIGPAVQALFFWPELLLALAVASGILMFTAAWVLRILRGL